MTIKNIKIKALVDDETRYRKVTGAKEEENEVEKINLNGVKIMTGTVDGSQTRPRRRELRPREERTRTPTTVWTKNLIDGGKNIGIRSWPNLDRSRTDRRPKG